MKWKLLAILFCVLLVAISAGAVAGSTGDFTIHSDASISVPDQTESVQQGAFTAEVTITEIAVYDPTDDVVIQTSYPEGTTPSVTLWDSDENQYNQTDPDEQGSVNYGAELPKGGYVATLIDDDTIEAFLPIIVETYYVDSLTLNGEPLEGQEIDEGANGDVTVELAAHSTQPTIEEVNMSVWTGETTETITLENTEGNSLTYHGELPEVDPEEYNVQIAIGGEDTASGDPEPLGLSESHSITIAKSEQEDDGGNTNGDGSGENTDQDPPSSDDDNDDDSSQLNDTDTDPVDDDATDVENTTDDSTTNTTDPTNTTTDTDQSTDDSDHTVADGDNESDDGPIGPTDTTQTDDDTTDDDTSLFALQGLIALLVGISALRRGRKRVSGDQD